MFVFDINTDAVVKHTKRLDKIHKSALPVAIRSSLNDAVFDVKTKTMPVSAKHEFTERQPNFFKANSRFENAKGFDIKRMKATVGMVSTNLKGGHNYAVKDLEQQERGGAIGGKSFIPLAEARISQNEKKVVRAGSRMNNIKKIINAKNNNGANWAQKAIKGAIVSGKGGLLLNPGYKGSVLYQIIGIKRIGRNTRFTKKKLYSFSKNRKVTVKATHFMRKASLKSAARLNEFYIKQAERQIKKYYNK